MYSSAPEQQLQKHQYAWRSMERDPCQCRWFLRAPKLLLLGQIATVTICRSVKVWAAESCQPCRVRITVDPLWGLRHRLWLSVPFPPPSHSLGTSGLQQIDVENVSYHSVFPLRIIFQLLAYMTTASRGFSTVRVLSSPLPWTSCPA